MSTNILDVEDISETLRSLCYDMLVDPYIYPKEFIYQAFLVRGLGIKYTIGAEHSINDSRMDIVIYSGPDRKEIIYVLELKCLDVDVRGNITYGEEGKDNAVMQLGRYIIRAKCRYGFLINFPKKTPPDGDPTTAMKMAGVHILRFEIPEIVPWPYIKITNDSFSIPDTTPINWSLPIKDTFIHNNLEFFRPVHPCVMCNKGDDELRKKVPSPHATYHYGGKNDLFILFHNSRGWSSIPPINVDQIVKSAMIEKDRAKSERDKAIIERDQAESKRVIAVNELAAYKTKVENEINSIREHMMAMSQTIEIVAAIQPNRIVSRQEPQ